MRAAATPLLGRHDFSAFRAAECQARSPVKELRRAEIERQRRLASVRIRRRRVPAPHGAQYRRLPGEGRQRQPARPTGCRQVLDSRDRERAAPTFAADGLYLTGVEYDAAWDLPSPGARAAAPRRPSRRTLQLDAERQPIMQREHYIPATSREKCLLILSKFASGVMRDSSQDLRHHPRRGRPGGAARAGAHAIGLVFHPASPRCDRHRAGARNREVACRRSSLPWRCSSMRRAEQRPGSAGRSAAAAAAVPRRGAARVLQPVSACPTSRPCG